MSPETLLTAQEEPEMREVRPGHYVSCHFAEELRLQALGAGA